MITIIIIDEINLYLAREIPNTKYRINCVSNLTRTL
jgi:hypothetical protein